MKIIKIEELYDFLGFSDLRAVRKWCANNEVHVITQGKNEFVFEVDFKLAYELPFINKLKRKFGDDWEQVYNLYNDGNIPELNTLFYSTSKPTPIYKINSETKSKLLSKLKDYEKKNVA